jgi:F0F1-type ATP synthase assembly protein I
VSEPAHNNRRISSGFELTFEFALSVLAFFGIGWLLDAWLGTAPLFMIVGFLLGVVANFVRLWYLYDHAMRTEESKRVLAGSVRGPEQ